MNLNFTLVLEIISFLILLGLLTKFLYGPVTKYLDERARDMAAAEKNARAAEEKARFFALESERALSRAREESVKMKKESRQIADGERRRIIEEAKKEARFLMERASAELGREKKEVMKGMRDDIASISVDIARKMLGREINEKDHTRLIKESMAELENEVFGPTG